MMSAIFTRAYRMMGNEIGHMVSQGAKILKMASEEGNLTDEMSIELFSWWKVDQLKTFLKKRGVVSSGRKFELAEKAYFAWKLTLVSFVTLKSFLLMSCDHLLYKLGRGHR